jgi:hypothetical protein
MNILNFRKYTQKKDADQAALELESYAISGADMTIYSHQDHLVVPFVDIVKVPVGYAHDVIDVQETVDNCYVVCVTRLLPSPFMIEYLKNGKSELYRKLLKECGNINDRIADYSSPVGKAVIK